MYLADKMILCSGKMHASQYGWMNDPWSAMHLSVGLT